MVDITVSVSCEELKLAQVTKVNNQPSPWAFSLAPLSARSLGKSGGSRRVSLGDVTAHGRVQD